MSTLKERFDFIRRASSYNKYIRLANEGNFSEALKLNQTAYEFFYEMYIKYKDDAEYKEKTKRILEKIARDGRLINTQLNPEEEKQ